jgi:hypothetical protein
MAPTTTPAVRVSIIERHLSGERLPTIAAALQLNVYTVRKFWRLYQHQGWEGLHLPRAGPPAIGRDPITGIGVLRRALPQWIARRLHNF